MSASAEDAAACRFAELPAAGLRSIAQCLWPDARDAAAFACCSSITRSVCNDQLLWRELLVRRYGERVIPGSKAPPEQYKAAELEGFVFYQGRDGSEETDEEHAAADMAQLAHLTQDAGAEAFTTHGRVIRSLKPQAAWRHSSVRPYEGMYVRQAAVQYRQLQEPQPAANLADASWPPSVPGWVYFPSHMSPGQYYEQLHDTLAKHQTLEAVLHAASQQNNIVAVTSSGELKSKLRPQACWEVHRSYDWGMYVRADVAQQMQLVPSPAVPDYRQLCLKLRQLRLDAGAMDCSWLNDKYLSLQHMHDSPAPSGMALVLDHVWWLDVWGSIPGVPPGCYEVAWVVDITHTTHLATLTLTAEAVPVHAQQQQGGAEPAAAAGQAVEAPGGQRNRVQVLQRWHPELQELQQQIKLHGAAWGVMSGGLLRVDDYSTVQLSCKDIDGLYKSYMRWAMVELVPVAPQEQQQVAAQRNRVWRPPTEHAGSQGHGGGAAGGAAAGVRYARSSMMAWLGRIFRQHVE